MKITKLIFAASFLGLMFLGTVSTDVLDQYKEPYITHKFQIVKKRCEDTVHNGREVQKCYLSDGKEWHWTEKPTYDTYKEGDTIKFVEYKLNEEIKFILITLYFLSALGFGAIVVLRLFYGG